MTTVYKQETGKALVFGFLGLVTSLVLIKQGNIKKVNKIQRKPEIDSKKMDKKEPSKITVLVQSDSHQANTMNICRVLKGAQFIVPFKMDITTIDCRRKGKPEIQAQEFLREAQKQVQDLYPTKPAIPLVVYINQLYIFIVH